MKKTLAFCLAAMMAVGMTTSAFAAERSITPGLSLIHIFTQGVQQEELFKATIDACHKAMKAGEFLDLMPSSGKFGKEAIEDKKPFYRKGITVEPEA